MKHIVERLKEKRDIEIAKSILESNGYRVSKPMRRVKESSTQLPTYFQDLITYLSDVANTDAFSEMFFSPQEFYTSEEELSTIVDLLNGSEHDIVTFHSEDYIELEDYGITTSLSYLFEPLQYPEFYKGSVVDTKNTEMGKLTLIKSSVGNVIQVGGWGVSAVYFTSETQRKLIDYIKNNVEYLTNYLSSKWKGINLEV